MTTLLTKILRALDAAREVEQQATPGPLFAVNPSPAIQIEGQPIPPYIVRRWRDDQGRRCVQVLNSCGKHQDNVFFASSRTDWPKHREALRELLETVRLISAGADMHDCWQANIAGIIKDALRAVAATLGIEEDGE